MSVEQLNVCKIFEIKVFMCFKTNACWTFSYFLFFIRATSGSKVARCAEVQHNTTNTIVYSHLYNPSCQVYKLKEGMLGEK